MAIQVGNTSQRVYAGQLLQTNIRGSELSLTHLEKVERLIPFAPSQVSRRVISDPRK